MNSPTTTWHSQKKTNRACMSPLPGTLPGSRESAGEGQPHFGRDRMLMVADHISMADVAEQFTFWVVDAANKTPSDN